MVSTTDKDTNTTTSEESTEKKSVTVPKVNILGLEVNLDTLAFVGTVLGVIGAGGTAWSLYNQWNQNKSPQLPQPPVPNPLAQRQYEEFVQAEMLRRQEMERQHNRQKKLGHENSDLSTVQPIVSSHQDHANVDYGRILDHEKQRSLAPAPYSPYNVAQQYQPPIVPTEDITNPNALIDMSLYNKRRNNEEEHEEEEEEVIDDTVEQQQQQQDPSIEELYKKANNSSYY